MPEIAEVRLMSDFINRSNRFLCTKITKNRLHKGEEVSLDDIGLKKAKIIAKSRGKELMIKFIDPKTRKPHREGLKFHLGMSGNFSYDKEDNLPPHSHLRFHLTNGYVISYVDPRRFGGWQWKDDWNILRGPDLFDEPKAFRERIESLLKKAPAKYRNTPTHIMMMNQHFFNGIGNYLRAEILYRMDVNPFQPIGDLLEKDMDRFIKTITEVCNLAYAKGGGRISTWKNPNAYKASMQNFFQCYKRPGMSSKVDKTGRTFWYDPKWDKA